MKYLLILQILFYSMSCLEPASAQTNAQWVDCSGEAMLQNISNEEAQAIAKRRARLDAVEKACGIKIQSESMVKDYQLLSDFIHSVSHGYVVEEKDIKWITETLHSKESNAPPTIIVKLSMRAKVIQDEGEPDPYFSVKLKLNKTNFIAGDEVILDIKPTKDCYITILNLAANDSVYVLLPNSWQSSQFVVSNKTISFPSDNLRESGFHLRVSNLPGHKRDTETVYVIATKQEINFVDDINNSAGFGVVGTPKLALQKLARWLTQIPIEERAEGSVMYNIYSK